MSDHLSVQPAPITSRFAYPTTALGGEQQAIVSIPVLRDSLRRAERNATRLAERVDRRDALIKEMCDGLVATTAYALRVANAVAAMTEGKLLAESSINAAAPSTLNSVSNNSREVIKYINSLLISVEDCIIAAVTGSTTVVFPDSHPITESAQITVDDVKDDAARTITHRLDNRTITSTLSPILSVLEL